MTTKKSGSPLLPIILTVFIDLVGVGIVIPIAAPLLLTPSTHLLPAHYSLSQRSIILGFLLGSYSIAQFFGAPVLGAMADKYGRKKLLLLSLAGTCVGYLFFAYGIFSHNIILCFASRILDGFTGGNISIAMSAIADVTDEKNRAKNFGLVSMSFGLGFILGPYIGGKLADPHLVSWFNLTTPYWFAAILSFLNILLLIAVFKETLHHKSNRKISLTTGFKNVKIAMSDPKLRAIFVAVFFVVFGFNFFTQFFQVFLIQKFQYTPSDIADIFAYIGLWLAFTQGVITRFLSKKMTSAQAVNFSLILLAITFPFLLIPKYSGFLYLILPFVAVFNGITAPNLTAVVSMQAGADQQGSILGIRQSMQSVAMAIPPIIAGFITSISASLPIYAAAFFTLTGWVIFRFLFHKKEVVSK